MDKEEAIKYFEKRKEKALMLMRKAKADTPTNNKFREIITKKIEALNEVINRIVMMTDWDNELPSPIIDAEELLVFIEKRKEEIRKSKKNT